METTIDTLNLEALLLSLLKGEHSSLTLGFNEMNAPNYQTVADFLDHLPEEQHPDWVSEEERLRARETNSMWLLHWYPDTPIGSYALAASSLPVLMEAAERKRVGGG